MRRLILFKLSQETKMFRNFDMLEKLDPHSAYIPPKDLEIRQSQLKGNLQLIHYDIL